MTSRRHIVVLFHADVTDRALPSSAVYHFAPYWREGGHDVTFLRGVKRFVPADLAFVHVDLSVVPDEYLELAARYPVAVNGRVKDIRKSVISENLVHPGDAWDGPVIVKSDLNCAGEPELAVGVRGILSRNKHARNVLRFLDRAWTGVLPSPFHSWRDYRIFEHRDLVPRRLLHDRRVVIERFLPELDGGRYHLGMYQFLGDRWSCLRLASTDVLLKAGNSLSIERVNPHPDLEVWRRRLHLDYGKIDYVMHNDRPVMLDANKTTGAGELASGPELEQRRRHRAMGIESLFAE